MPVMELKQVFSKINNHKPTILGDNIREYSILVPLIIKDNEIHVLFEVRSMEMRSQPGEICFPGGRVEEQDLTPMDGAIRETAEELGIETSTVKRVHPLNYIVQSMEGRIIYPFAAFIDTEILEPNPSEVKEVFTVPLTYLLNQQPEKHSLQFQIGSNDHFPFHLIPGGRNYPFRIRGITEYFYFYKDYCIWGLTAKILNHFLSILDNEVYND
jgi:coenzyme A diphosphatase NUDT7